MSKTLPPKTPAVKVIKKRADGSVNIPAATLAGLTAFSLVKTSDGFVLVARQKTGTLADLAGAALRDSTTGQYIRGAKKALAAAGGLPPIRKTLVAKKPAAAPAKKASAVKAETASTRKSTPKATGKKLSVAA